MCANRLAVGEAPACAQACPSEAIRITIVDQSALAAAARRGEFLPGAPNPNITLPSTRYKSTRSLPANLLGGDHAYVTPSCPHVPLIFMLVFTQLSVGASVAAIFTEPAKWLALVAGIVGAMALGIATLHLGRPLKAWRAFLGWRKSWFSREVIVFGGYLPLTAATAMALWFGCPPYLKLGPEGWEILTLTLKVGTALAGLAGITCSAMIYADTGREFWRASQCFGKFLGTTVLLGAVTTLAIKESARPTASTWLAGLVGLVFVTATAKLGFEHRVFRNLVDEETPGLTPLNKTARLLVGRLGLLARTRLACGIVGGCLVPVLLMLNHTSGNVSHALSVLAAFTFCVSGELLERFLFFSAVAPAKMPGGVAS
jgi:DMSO reductase anchor subunit